MNMATTSRDLNTRKAKFGLVQVREGARVTVPNGKRKTVVTVGDKTRYPDAKYEVRCLTCGKAWPKIEAMIAEHPAAAAMVEAEEVHPWGWFSSDPTERPETPPKGATEAQAAEIEAKNKAIPKIGLVSDDLRPWAES
jgi:hypothetical protein